MLPKSWKPVPSSDLLLVGPPGDGGCLVSAASIEPATLLLSMGLSDDWRFEEDFRRRTGAGILCFDGTVDRRFWRSHIIKSLLRLQLKRAFKYRAYKRFFSGGDVRHETKMIGYDAPGYIGLATILAQLPDRHIFLKVDIEGAEYRILDDIVRGADRFTGVAMEFHDVDLHRERIDRFVREMSDFHIVALHPNNWGGVDREGDPLVFEMSLARRALHKRPRSGETIPSKPPNTTTLPEIVAQYG